MKQFGSMFAGFVGAFAAIGVIAVFAVMSGSIDLKGRRGDESILNSWMRAMFSATGQGGFTNASLRQSSSESSMRYVVDMTPVACASKGDDCACYNNDGAKLPGVSKAQCRDNVKNGVLVPRLQIDAPVVYR